MICLADQQLAIEVLVAAVQNYLKIVNSSKIIIFQSVDSAEWLCVQQYRHLVFLPVSTILYLILQARITQYGYRWEA